MDGLFVAPYSWVFPTFIGIGLLLVLLELIVGVETGLDLVFTGSAFIIGGLVTWPFNSWVLALVVTLAICIAYVALGRRYVHRWTAPRKEKTNVDLMIGKKGTAIESLTPGISGRVRVGNEDWSARAEEQINKGEEVVVTAVNGVTLVVETRKGGK